MGGGGGTGAGGPALLLGFETRLPKQHASVGMATCGLHEHKRARIMLEPNETWWHHFGVPAAT